MNIIIVEDHGTADLLPLTWLRSCAELRCGRDRLLDRYRTQTGGRLVGHWTRPEIQDVVADRVPLDEPDPHAPWCIVNARTLLTGDVTFPPLGGAWQIDGEFVAAGIPAEAAHLLRRDEFVDPARVGEWLAGYRSEPTPEAVRLVRYPWDLIHASPGELRRQLTQGGLHQGEVSSGTHLLQPGHIHIARGARIKPGAVLDAEDGPIEIARDVLIQPNAVLEGPCYIGPGTVVRAGSSIRPGTSVGPVCKVGGEIDHSLIHGYSNKQHDGFLGYSYIGEWVNLGADTLTSDLKNTYGTIRASICGRGVETGHHFLGSIIGDHSKTGIGTLLPTGCIIGVASNIFKNGALPRFVPSFAWLTEAGMTAYRVEKAVDIARIVMARRDV